MQIRRKYPGIAQGDLTPMIDMTFQLIAFFMVLINFSEAEQDARVKLPESELAKPPEVPLKEYITVQLTKDARCIVQGKEMPLEDDKDSFRRVLLIEADLIEKGGKTVSDTTIIVRAHREAATEKVQLLIELCQDARFEKFVLRAKEKL